MSGSEPVVRRDSRLFTEVCSVVLSRGHAVRFHVQGQSMRPNILDGDQVVIAPVKEGDLRRGDVVLTESGEGLRLHRVSSCGHAFGTVLTQSDTGIEPDLPSSRLFGKVSDTLRGANEQSLSAWRTRCVHPACAFLRRLYAATVLRLRRLAFLFSALLMVALSSVFIAPAAHGQTADLQLTQTASASAVAAGSNYTYTEAVVNNTSSATVTSGTITVYMQTPPNTTFQSYASTQTVPGTNDWNCSTTPAAGGVGPIICYYELNLASGAAATSFTVTFQVAAGTAAGTTVQGSATVTNSTFVDTAPANNTSITSIIVEPATSSDLALSMSVSPTPVFINGNLTYTIQVQNLGQASAPIASDVLTDNLPSGLTNVSVVASSGWSCSGTATITCSITSAMAMGATATITITATTPSSATTLSNTATVSLPGDPNSANNSATSYTVVQPLACATPGRDGVLAAPTTSTIVNTYFPPTTATLTAGTSTSVTLGAAKGATTPIAAGDLVLIIQMQDATINHTNTSSYGDGVPGDPGSGSTSLGSSGLFEFVTATSAVPVTGGTLTFTGTGNNGALLNSYYLGADSTTQGQETYQVIRVPQYRSATFSSDLTALAWNGSVGGVLAVDVSSQLTLGGTVALDSMGFRGGGGITLGGLNGLADTDYVTDSPTALPTLDNTNHKKAAGGTGANASKGEGIAGTPHWIAPLLSTVTTTTTATSTAQSTLEGLPAGSFARGAPGNAGGGGTDGDPAGNDYNSGGGAGGNGGVGGQGGYGWNSMAATNSTDGGFGGVTFPASTSALVMGGGGGAGTTNDGSYYTATGSGADCGTACTGIYSSGGAGGGIVIIHAGSVVGTGTITANGESTLSTLNDSTGGGGAGGSILVFANSGGLSGLTVNAVGGNGGNAWQIEAPGGFPGQRHGPGGGGGGGVIYLSAALGSASVAGGSNGYTDTVQDSYGATPGQPGVLVTTNVITETPGTQSGAYCGTADLAVTNSGTPPVVAPGGNITYTQTVTNNGPLDAVNAVFTESVPGGTTFQSITPASGWTCTYPAVGGTSNITCTDPDFAANGSGTFTVVVQASGSDPSGTEIVDVDNITSGTPDPNLANNTATVVTTVGTTTPAQADLAVTLTASPTTVLAGSNVTMTAVVTNNGPATASGLVFTEPLLSNSAGTLSATLVSYTASGWSCTTPAVNGIVTLTCTLASMNTGGTSTITIVENVPAGAASGTVLSSTDNIAASTPDPNYDNNSGTATIVVATSGQADLAVSSSGTPNPVTPGNNITYTQSITNNGPTAITASGSTTVTFTDALPYVSTNPGVPYATLVSFTPPTGWTCTVPAVGSTGTITCTLNSSQTFTVGAVFNFPLVVKVPLGTAAGTTITNSPSISSSVTDPNPSNNTVTVSTLVASPTQADVTITKSASPNPVDQGTNLTYTIVVTNNGPAVAQGVNVSDPIPSQVTYSSASSTQGTCTYTSSTTTVNCSLGSLGVGNVAVVTINVTAAVFGSGAVDCNGITNVYTTCNTASLSTTTSNPNTSVCVDSTLPAPNACAGSIIQASTAVDLASANAFSQPDGSVRLVWRTLEETRNLGFHIYREDASGQHRIDRSLIAGSALTLRGSRPQHVAKLYAWVDSQPAPNAAYWIEDVDVNGTRSTHGPLYPQPASRVENESQVLAQAAGTLAVSPSLSQLHSSLRSANSSSRRPMIPLPVFPPIPEGIPLFNAADHPAVKISVDQEGWYHISFAQLFSAGLDPNTDVRLLHLYAEGIEQPLLLIGHTSGLASPTDAIEFYGTDIDTPFSGTRIYWLVRENLPSKRILPATPTSSAGAVPVSFPFTLLLEDRTTYFAALLNGENNDNFFGAVITSDPTDQTLTVVHRDTSSNQPLTLNLTLQGATDQQQHSVSVQFNGTNVGTFNFYGEILAQQSFSVDPSLVLDGANTVTLSALDGDNDVSLVQSIQLQYLHTYTADSDWLRATAASGSDLLISGFTYSSIRVFDITNPLDISELSGEVSAQSGTYNISVAIPTGGRSTHTILAFSQDTVSAPLFLAPHVPTFVDEQRSGADMVIITHPDFASHLAPLVNLRTSQGYKVLQVTTDEIYDQFNYGEHSPFALRTFLQGAAQNWQRKPQLVLLVGDASMDPRNYLGFGDFDFVPTRIIETAAFKTASDDWLTDFQQTGYPTIPTGRLPVRTRADIDLAVSKIVGYEQGQFAGSWNSQALLIADQNVDANFSAAVASAGATLPPSLETSQILTDGMDQATAHSQIVAALNNGALLVDYNGHGAEQQWSFSDIFDNSDAAALTNGGQLPVYLLMDCLNGLFQDVYAETLAKSLIFAPNGGAIAVWASSGFTQQPPQASMDLAFLHEFAAHPSEPLGLMVLNAKKVTTDNDVRRTWILFGDPALHFHFIASSSGPVSGWQHGGQGTLGVPRACAPGTICSRENQ